MNAPDAICCSGCGRELDLSPPTRKVSEACPRCGEKLDAIYHERGLALDCSACGGQFAEHSLLKDLLQQRARLAELLPRRPRRMELAMDAVKYLSCPKCGQMMNRKNFGGTSGVIVDVCTLHGTWFDAGELAAVLAFVESGGKVEAKRPERPAAPPQPSLALGEVSGGGVRGTSLADVVLDLLDFLMNVLKK
jgi:Zn-finger nucleic acid-binding protein